MRGFLFATAACALGLAAAPPARGSSIEQELGGYTDNEGLTWQRVGYDAILDSKPSLGNMTNNKVEIIALHDQYERADMTNDAYDKQVYQSGTRANETLSVLATQTWDRLTDTRVLAAYSSDHEVSSRSWGVGADHWVHDETVRLSLDLSRTLLDQPLYQFLDTDLVTVANPTIATQSGVTAGVRHLATPTTIVDYTATYVLMDNRPPEKVGTVAVRQFIVPANGAAHVTVSRGYNRGYITPNTTYGQVDAWTYDVAWLQNLWRGAKARFDYRWYKEDETTRAWGSDKVFGSDTMTTTLSQDLPKGAVDALGVPLTIDATAGRYITNVALSATVGELGISAKF